ncbi:MAG TPA: hypothetical protein VGG69_12155, partial [Rhizomicrobium sp.]
MQGKLRLLAGVAGGALFMSGVAVAQTTTTTVMKQRHHHHLVKTRRVRAVAESRTIADLERRIDALEAEVHRAQTQNARKTATARPRHHRVGNPEQATMDVAAAPPPAEAGLALDERVRQLEQQLDAQKDRDEAEHTRLVTLEQNFNDTTWSFDNLRPT